VETSPRLDVTRQSVVRRSYANRLLANRYQLVNIFQRGRFAGKTAERLSAVKILSIL